MKLKILLFLGFLYVSSNLYSQNIDSLLVVARNTKNDSLSITKLNIAGYFCIFQNAEKAYSILQEGKKKALRTKRTYNYIELINTEGVYHDLTGNKDSAQFYFAKALKMSHKEKFLNLEVRATNNMGMINWNIGNFSDALGYFLKALELNENIAESPTKSANSTMYNNIGLIYQEMNMPEKALSYHLQAYEERVRKNRRNELPTSFNNLGICYERLGKREQAEAAYKEGIAIARDYKSPDYYKLLENYSGILIDKEQYTEARDILLEALNRPPGAIFHNKSKFILYGELANVYVNLQQPDIAIKYGKLGLEMLEEDPDLKLYSTDIYLSLSRAYYMQGDIDKGHTYSINFSKVTREKFSSENATELAAMEVKYETEKKEKLIAEGRLNLLKAEADMRRSEALIAEGEAELSKSLAEGEKNKKLIAENSVRLLKSEAETQKKEKLIAVNKARLLKTEAEARQKNYMLMISLFFIVFLGAIGYLLFRQQQLKSRQMEKEFELKSALAEIENQNRLQEQRLTISRDLHDNIGAQLTFIISSLDNLKYRLTENIPAVGNKLEGISNFTQQTIIELRDTIWAMNTKHITFEDLRVRILNFMEKAQEANENIDFKFRIDPVLMDVELSSVTGMNIYRTIQEAVNNAIKHSGATSMEIIVFDELDMVSIIMRDNGSGFDRDTTLPGNGLQNMEKRMEGIGGSFTLTSAPEEGTIIKIHLHKKMQSA